MVEAHLGPGQAAQEVLMDLVEELRQDLEPLTPEVVVEEVDPQPKVKVP